MLCHFLLPEKVSWILKGGNYNGILAIGEYIKHWKRNVFVVIQISVLLLVLCVSVTMLATIFRAYKPVQHMADKKGIYVTSFGYHGVNAKDIANGMKKVESVYSWGIPR